MESKPEGNKCRCCEKLVIWYNEIDDTSKAKSQQDAAYKGSTVEIFMFYLGMFFTLLFCGFTAFWCKFEYKFLLFLIPLAIWMFLRSSRKDMSATAYLIAGLFGAFGGALIVILKELFINRVVK